VKEEEQTFQPMPASELMELLARATEPGCKELSMAMPNEKIKRLVETIFWLTGEHAQAMNDLQTMKWMKVALMAITNQWGRGGKLGISPKATEKVKDNWQLAISVDLKGSIKLKIDGYKKPNLLIYPGAILENLE